ncbi:MAG: 50S ribosome-binding GTPase [Lachnospiraceae bacterium]|nr:50S ribosome-binding GTPase [Lachnospiraceae bacterium]MCR5129542.1 50S ribosome-binding GTPase [Lachnospiraceae bacterium]
MQLGNVLLIGESGVGKSTLINAVLKREETEVGFGMTGTTQRMEIYEGEGLPFRVIDTIGFEPTFFRKTKAINAVKKWSKDSAKKKKDEEEKEDKQIHAIWFCVEGTRRKLFYDTIKSMLRATSMWKSIPIVVVITKSYSSTESEENIKMVKEAFRKTRQAERLKEVIPVVAAPFVIQDDIIVPPKGIDVLINKTNELMPEAIRMSQQDVAAYILQRKRALAQGVVATSVVLGVTVTAVPIPIADGLMLSSLELAEIKAIAGIYEIKKGDKSKRFIDSIIEVGTVSAVARTAISALKAIPGINIAASIMNGVIGGSFVTILGEGAAYAFEQIYLGKKSLDDIDWVKKMMESKLAEEFSGKAEKVIKNLPEKPNFKNVSQLIVDTFSKKS